ncbi:MAG: MFS transporter [Clostridia bacterium]
MSENHSTSTMYRILLSISIVHLLNDSMQAAIPAILPILKDNLLLSYFQLGVILFINNVTASLLQPVIGYFSDRMPRPFLLPLSMCFSGLGMLGIAFANSYTFVLLSVSLVGIGSAFFHPEASRVAHMASGPRRGLGQSIFQVGGNAGSALGPLMTAWIFLPFGQSSASLFTLTAATAFVVLFLVSRWYKKAQRSKKAIAQAVQLAFARKRYIALILLIIIVSVRSWLYAGFQSFYPLFLIDVQHLPRVDAQFHTFIFLLAGAIGTVFGGPLADRFGKRTMILLSTLGALPVTMLIPYVSGMWTYPLLFLDGLILLSCFSVTVVYAQELLPGRIGTVSGLIIGLSFGMGGIGAAMLGRLADLQGLTFVIVLCSVMPLIGVLGFFLPKDETIESWEKVAA